MAANARCDAGHRRPWAQPADSPSLWRPPTDAVASRVSQIGSSRAALPSSCLRQHRMFLGIGYRTSGAAAERERIPPGAPARYRGGNRRRMTLTSACLRNTSPTGEAFSRRMHIIVSVESLFAQTTMKLSSSASCPTDAACLEHFRNVLALIILHTLFGTARLREPGNRSPHGGEDIFRALVLSVLATSGLTWKGAWPRHDSSLRGISF